MFSRGVHVKMLWQQHISSPALGNSGRSCLQAQVSYCSSPLNTGHQQQPEHTLLQIPRKTPKKPTQTMKFNTISAESPLQCRATASMDQSRTLQSSSEHKCNSFRTVC